MALPKWSGVVQALPADASNQAFAVSDGLWSPHRRFHHTHTKALQSLVHRPRKNAVTVVKQDSVGMAEG